MNIDIIIRSLFRRGGVDEAKGAMQQAGEAANALGSQGTNAGRVIDDVGKKASTAGKGGITDFRKGAEAAQLMAASMAQALRGGVGSFTGIAAAAKGAAGAIAGSFGPAGIAALAIGASAGLLIEFGSRFFRPKKEAEDLTTRIDGARKAIEELNSAQLAQLEADFRLASDEADALNRKLQTALDLRRQIAAAKISADVAEIQARQARGDVTPGAAAEQIAGLRLNQRLADARTPVERASIATQAAEERARIAAEAIADLEQERFNKLQRLAVDETFGARLQREINVLELTAFGARQKVRQREALDAEESRALRELELKRQQLEEFQSAESKAEREARNKAIDDLEKEIVKSREKAAKAARDAAAAAEEEKAIREAVVVIEGAVLRQAQAEGITRTATGTGAAGGGGGTGGTIDPGAFRAAEIQRRQRGPTPPTPPRPPGFEGTRAEWKQQFRSQYRAGADIGADAAKQLAAAAAPAGTIETYDAEASRAESAAAQIVRGTGANDAQVRTTINDLAKAAKDLSDAAKKFKTF